MEIARATAAAVPAEVSTKPLLGILGVVTGAGVVTLTSRMISLGMPDYRMILIPHPIQLLTTDELHAQAASTVDAIVGRLTASPGVS